MEINWFYAIAMVFLFFGVVFFLVGDLFYALTGLIAGGIFAYLGVNGKKEGKNARGVGSGKLANVKCN